jgi:hypothetical protein
LFDSIAKYDTYIVAMATFDNYEFGIKCKCLNQRGISISLPEPFKGNETGIQWDESSGKYIVSFYRYIPYKINYEHEPVRLSIEFSDYDKNAQNYSRIEPGYLA